MAISEEFLWGTGIEGSAIPHLGISQFEWTGHDRRWRQDLRAIRDRLGPCWLRYPLSWERVHLGPGKFHWGPAEERLALAHELGFRVVAGLVHFGTPAWLASAFGDPDFPTMLEEWALAAGERFDPLVAAWVPINEPLVTALFAGDVGLWPPFGRGWRAYMPVLCRIAEGLTRATRALRAVSRREVWWVEAIEDHRAEDPGLADELARRNARRFLVLDLASGRVDDDHPLFDWLLEHGFSPFDLEWLRRNAQTPDRLGLDYYLQSEIHVWLDGDQVKQRLPDTFRGFTPLAAAYHERYGWPLVVTETNSMGDDDRRLAWLESIVGEVRRGRAAGLPVTGLFWWPAFDHLDWDGAMLHHSGNIHPVGLWRLVPDAHGDAPHLEQTSVATRFGELAAAGLDLPPLRLPAVASTLPAGPRGAAESPGAQLAAIAPRAAASPPLVLHSHIRWGSVWHRPQQLATRLARRRPVLYLEEPRFSADVVRGRLRTSEPSAGVTLAVPELPRSLASRPADADAAVVGLLRRHRSDPSLAPFASAAHMLTTPAAQAQLAAFAPQLVVYDCLDDLARFDLAAPGLGALEAALLGRADLVLTRGEGLYHRLRAAHSNVHWIPGGVDPERWQHPGAAPHDIAFVPRPRLGYVGAVDERLDHELLRGLAEHNPGWSLVFIGPILKVDPARVPRGPNLYYLGKRSYPQLPAYVAALDACLIPFRLGRLTELAHPAKTLEYLAAGKPVISTPLPEVVAHFGDAVHFAVAEHFEERVREVLAGRRIDADAGLARAAQSRWEAVVARVESLLEEALRAKGPAAELVER